MLERRHDREMLSAAARASNQHCTPKGVRNACWFVAINISTPTECEPRTAII